jgi:hypothetical protein
VQVGCNLHRAPVAANGFCRPGSAPCI